MKRFPLLAATLAGLIGFSGLASPAQAASCWVVDPAWIAGHTNATGVLNTRVATMGTNIATQRALTLEMLLSAVKVNTAQISTNGAREANLASNVNQAVASTLSQLTQRQALVDAREQYSYESGQGVNACDSISLMSATNGAIGNVSMTGRESYRDLDVSPGKVTPMPEATKRRLANPMITNAAVLLDPNASDLDRKTVIEAMAGLPMPKPTPGMPGSEADLMMLKARRVEALRSPALVSLSSVRAMSAADGHVVGSTATSLMAQLEQLIGQYGGGPQFEAWSAGLAAQSEHGLLLELTRLRSMSLTLRQSLIEQQARTTAVFGTMLATQAGGDL
ncbi:MAG: hypothetical protein WAP03_06120 [Methylorubrum rhodinum]|uniref:hypothetical protein n=1 Tax=Methylorubrum rhodinum TaxID=29428 RepID=UPI003BB1788C